MSMMLFHILVSSVICYFPDPEEHEHVVLNDTESKMLSGDISYASALPS